MAAVLSHDCPYCGTRSVAMTYEGHCIRETPRRTSYYDVWVLLSCGKCRAGCTARFSVYGGDASSALSKMQSREYQGDFDGLSLRFHGLQPDRGSGSAPEGCPERVSELFDQAFSNLSNGHWDASGAMSRKCLDVATKVLARERIADDTARDQVLGSWLKKRIELLCENSVLSREVTQLAMVIKDNGDGAAHDEEPYSSEEAHSMLEYCTVFLTYAFTIPTMLNAVAATIETNGT